MIDRKLHLIPSGIIGGFNKRIQELLRIPTYTPKISDVMRPTLITGILKGDADSPNPGVPAIISAIKNAEGNIAILTTPEERGILRGTVSSETWTAIANKYIILTVPDNKKWVIKGFTAKRSGGGNITADRFIWSISPKISTGFETNVSIRDTGTGNTEDLFLLTNNITLQPGSVFKVYIYVTAWVSDGDITVKVLHQEYDI